MARVRLGPCHSSQLVPVLMLVLMLVQWQAGRSVWCRVQALMATCERFIISTHVCAAAYHLDSMYARRGAANWRG